MCCTGADKNIISYDTVLSAILSEDAARSNNFKDANVELAVKPQSHIVRQHYISSRIKP